MGASSEARQVLLLNSLCGPALGDTNMVLCPLEVATICSYAENSYMLQQTADLILLVSAVLLHSIKII